MLAQTQYIKSAFNIKQLPADQGREIVLAGRSNAGKSSFLNTITNQKALARTSKTPGRTQAMNVFSVAEDKRIVDLPGYGYAKVPSHIRLQWGKMLDEYFRCRQSLSGIILIMDCRHPLKESDQELLSFASIQNIATHVVLTKADKLTYSKQKSTIMFIERTLGEDVTCQLFSSNKVIGHDLARIKLLEMLAITA